MTFPQCWACLQDHGWVWRSGTGLVSYFYLRPGGKLAAEGGRDGHDFYTTEEALLAAFIRDKAPLLADRDDANDGGETKREPAKRREAPARAAAGRQLKCQRKQTFAEIWSELKDDGWFWRNGAGLVSYYYMRPGGKLESEGGQDGVDFFTTESALMMHFNQ